MKTDFAENAKEQDTAEKIVQNQHPHHHHHQLEENQPFTGKTSEYVHSII